MDFRDSLVGHCGFTGWYRDETGSRNRQEAMAANPFTNQLMR